jgi:HAMP domain-containing protein
MSLKWKIGGIFTIVMLVLGALAIVGVYRLAGNALRDQLDQRVVAIANNLSDAAAGPIVAKNSLALYAITTKYTLLDGVAYTYVENGQGEILAHTLGTFPPELRQELPAAGARQVQRREISLQGKEVYETSVPILEGQLGTVRVGFWQESIEKEVQRALMPLITIVAAVPLVGALLAFLLAHWIVRPIVGLTRIADKVTMGDLETSVSGECVRSRDEIGDLARSLERMRSSLKAAMLRLGREVA